MFLSNLNKRFSLKKRTQKGAMSTDMLIGLGVAAVILVIIVMKVPAMRYSLHESQLENDINSISDAAFKWKKVRPNYAGVNIKELCSRNLLDKTICGAGDAKNTNPFGGDYVIAANKNPGLYDITFTFPNDSEYAADLADAVAPMTRGLCSSATGCTKYLKPGANSIMLTI